MRIVLSELRAVVRSVLFEAPELMKLEFSECEHESDMEYYVHDIRTSGGTIVSSKLNPDNETCTIEFRVNDRAAFAKEFLETESAGSESPPVEEPGTATMSNVDKIRYLDNVVASKKPYLKGQWNRLKERVGTGNRVWHAVDPDIGDVYLVYTSGSSFKRVGSLRDPGGTRYTYEAKLNVDPSMFGGSNSIFYYVAVGEGREDVKLNQARLKMDKLFGVDPEDWMGSLPGRNQQKQTSSTGEKSYKIYGKKANMRTGGYSPAHTRFKGKAYLAPDDTRFQSGDQAFVEPADGRLKVKKVDSDHTQSWEPESE